MTRTVFRGGRVVDGTGSAPAEADVVVEDGRFVEIGPGLDGDEAVDVSGRHLLPGMFDCHIHLASTYEDFVPVRTVSSFEPPSTIASRSNCPVFAAPVVVSSVSFSPSPMNVTLSSPV